jgi:hypothetical protein
MMAIPKHRSIPFFGRLLILMGALCLLAACEPEFKRVDVKLLSDPPMDFDVDNDFIEIDDGMGIMVKLKPKSKNSIDYDSKDRIECASSDDDIFLVLNGAKHGEFGIVGISSGIAALRVKIDGVHETDIKVKVR